VSGASRRTLTERSARRVNGGGEEIVRHQYIGRPCGPTDALRVQLRPSRARPLPSEGPAREADQYFTLQPWSRAGVVHGTTVIPALLASAEVEPQRTSAKDRRAHSQLRLSRLELGAVLSARRISTQPHQPARGRVALRLTWRGLVSAAVQSQTSNQALGNDSLPDQNGISSS
jgi:hypothetical protein